MNYKMSLNIMHHEKYLKHEKIYSKNNHGEGNLQSALEENTMVERIFKFTRVVYIIEDNIIMDYNILMLK